MTQRASFSSHDPVKWDGEAFFGTDLIVFRGCSVANHCHAMPVTVVAMSHDRQPVILDRQSQEVAGPVCLIRPGTQHIVAPDRPLTIAFLTPAKWALKGAKVLTEQDGFAQLDPVPFPDPKAGELNAVASGLEMLFQRESARMDERVRIATLLLAREPGALSIADAAAEVGLSPSRLRALARRDLGASLASWLIWKKLEFATKSVATGEGLAQSAVSGGFVDQAHFANVMRRLLGTAPSEIEPVRTSL